MADRKLNILIGAKNLASGGIRSVSKSIKTIGAVARGSGRELAKLGYGAEKTASKNISGFRKAAVHIRRYRIELKKSWKEAAKLKKRAGELTSAGAKNIAIGLAIASPLIFAGKAAADYEQGLVDVQAVTQANAEEMTRLDALAIKMGRDTAWSAKAATEGQLALSKAGLSVHEILNGALKSSLNLASSSVLNLAEASEMTAFGLKVFKHDAVEAAKVANIFAGVENKSAADARSLKESLVAASPAITALKVGFEDANAVLAMFADKQLKGSLAGTALKTTLLRLQPTAKPAASVMKKLGIISADGANAFFTLSGKMKSMAEVAEVLKKSMSHLTEKQRIHYLTTMFGQEGLAGAVSLYEAGADTINQYKKKLGDVNAEQLAEKKLDSVSGQMTILKGSVETAAITLGKNFLPEIKSMTMTLVNAVNRVTRFMSSNKKLTMAFIIGTAALSAFVITMGAAQMAIGGMMAIKSLILFMKGFQLASVVATTAQYAWSAAMGVGKIVALAFGGAVNFAIWPVTLIVAAVAALTYGIYKLYQNWEKVKGFFRSLPVVGKLFGDADKKADSAGKKIAAVKKAAVIEKNPDSNPNDLIGVTGATKLPDSAKLTNFTNVVGKKVPGGSTTKGTSSLGILPIPSAAPQKETRIEINYHPTIEFKNAVSDSDRENFKSLLKAHAEDIVKLVRQKLQREASLAY